MAERGTMPPSATRDSGGAFGAVFGDRLGTRWLGATNRVISQVGSTNDELARMAAAGAPHGTVLVADAQTAGRGRMGREWVSVAGQNIYLSLLLRPTWPPAAASLCSLAAAVGVAEGVRSVVGWSPRVKWPNDILSGQRKLAGILAEMSADRDRIRHIVIGVGINVNQIHFEEPLAHTATSLRIECRRSLNRDDVLTALLRGLEHWLDLLLMDRRGEVLEGWRSLADWLGSRVTVRTPQGALVGVAVEVDDDGALHVRDESGRDHRVLSGDVSLRFLGE